MAPVMETLVVEYMGYGGKWTWAQILALSVPAVQY